MSKGNPKATAEHFFVAPPGSGRDLAGIRLGTSGARLGARLLVWAQTVPPHHTDVFPRAALMNYKSVLGNKIVA